MKPSDISKVQNYLRKVLGNNNIVIDTPTRRGAPVEVRVGDEFLGVVHRDDEDGETSFSLIVSILEEDLDASASSAALPKPSPSSGRPGKLTTTSSISDGPDARHPISFSKAATRRDRSQ